MRRKRRNKIREKEVEIYTLYIDTCIIYSISQTLSKYEFFLSQSIVNMDNNVHYFKISILFPNPPHSILSIDHFPDDLQVRFIELSAVNTYLKLQV